jgi:hypothetical protein
MIISLGVWGHDFSSGPALFQVGHAKDHGAIRIEGRVLEPPLSIELSHALIEWLGDNREASDVMGSPERRPSRECSFSAYP